MSPRDQLNKPGIGAFMAFRAVARASALSLKPAWHTGGQRKRE